MALKTSAPRPGARENHPDRDVSPAPRSRPRPARHGTSRNHPDRDDLAAFVRSQRRGEGLTQRALAELAGVAPKVIWELEHGKPTMRMDVIDRVLRVFGKRLGVVERPRPEVDE